MRAAILAVFLSAAAIVPAVSAPSESDIDAEQSLYAQRWVEAFRRLDATNNIVMVLSNRDSIYEIDYVVEVEAQSRFLILRCMPPDGRSYRAIVYPATILLIRETPEGARGKARP